MVVNFKRLASLHLAVAGMAGLSPGLAQETGEELYHAACAACHGGDGSGNSATQLGFLDLAVPDFTDCDFAAREPDPDWYAVIHAGGPVRGFDRMMPSFGDALEPDQIQAILDHVRTMCTDDRWPRGEFNLPRALFTEKAYPEDEVVLTTWLEGGDRNTFIHEFLWEYRFGAQNQIEIALPFQVTDFGGEQGRQGGTGDLEIGLKAQPQLQHGHRQYLQRRRRTDRALGRRRAGLRRGHLQVRAPTLPMASFCLRTPSFKCRRCWSSRPRAALRTQPN